MNTYHLNLLEKNKNPHDECQLVVDNETTVKHKIDSGIFIDTRRCIRKQFVISDVHPKTVIYYKSVSARRREENRHLNNYYYVIHPCSAFSLWWEIMMFFVYIYMLIVYSLDDLFMFSPKYLYYINIMKFIGDCVYVVDIIHIFVTGYYDADLSKSILNPWKICKKYLKRYFIIDLIAIVPSICIPFGWLGLINEIEDPVLRYLRFIGIIRVFRLGRVFNALDLISMYKNFSIYIYKITKVILLYAITLCVMYFFLFVIRSNIRKYHKRALDSIPSRYLQATMMLMLIAHSRSVLIANILVVSNIAFFMICGMLLYLVLFAQLLQALRTFISTKTTTSTVIQQFEKYMRYKGLPIELRQKIYTFFDFKFQQEFYHEKRMHYFVSDALMNRILMDICRRKFKYTHLFVHIPNLVLFKLVGKLKSAIYLEDDVIMDIGVPNDFVYFIFYGTLAVYDHMGQEICHLEDGASFGELSLLKNGRASTVKIIAVAPTEIFKLHKQDFFNILKDFPEVKRKVIEKSFSRYSKAQTDYY
ncbi:potassium/sodium hyperpolarization-activated cyclic nucleotide-gated channel 1-like [Diabrotica virgifera virgifera]|uniref:Cyclic nucleotide-binding domain-containing protein n=1 Tax=Diabrotica virgifera virgifera TaxID=50390 RepID=A0ABM5KYD3_DIAVI|nr:potassium/sodium hyperpolarization-activated cyclic nucleotide-gated channel 1-like [Diabrotica virgifera virgifera]